MRAAAATATQKTRIPKRDRTILDHLPLVRAIAVRVHENLPVHVDLDDLVHAGILGLMDAVDKFDASKQVQFSSYAKHRIKGAILDSLRQLDWASRDLRRRQREIAEATRVLTAALERAPGEEELANHLGIGLDRCRRVMLDMRNAGLISASSRANDQDDSPLPDFPGGPEQRPDRICARSEMRSAVIGAMSVLPPRYRKVVGLYYSGEMTMKEIGGVLGVNESRVSQIHKAALLKMAAALEQEGIRTAEIF